MIRSLNTGVLGIRQFQTSLDAIGNNLANVNTVGYKSARVDFSDTLAQTLRAPTPDSGGGTGVAGMQVGNGVTVTAIKNEFTQGAVKQTGVRTDLAIAGEGYFLVKDATTNQLFASRAGDFRIDKNGFLVTNGGHRVQGKHQLAPAYSDSEKSAVGDIAINVGKYIADNSGITIDDLNNDILTKAGHGYNTGSQVIFKSVVPTADPAITTSTVLFVRSLGTNTFSLHDTASNAAAGTSPVNFTAAGLSGGYTLSGGATISSYSIGADGKLNMLLTDGTQYVRAQVLLQDFRNPQALLKEGSNLYSNLATAGAMGIVSDSVSDTELLYGAKAPGSTGLGRIEGGALELSNVDMAREFSNMITTQRAFQANARVISTSDEILQEMMQIKR